MAKKLDTARLRDLATEIEGLKHSTPHMTDLAARYAHEQGLKLSFSGGAHVARMAGVSASSTESERAALANWANAARRKALGLEV